MFSVPDIMVVSILALLLFGPDQLPKMMRQAGRLMREVQSTSQAFVAEMERAADISDPIHETYRPSDSTFPGEEPLELPATEHHEPSIAEPHESPPAEPHESPLAEHQEPSLAEHHEPPLAEHHEPAEVQRPSEAR